MSAITTDLIMALRPCEDWPQERVSAVIGDGQSLREFASNSHISEADRIWVLAGLMKRTQYLLFRAAIAEAILLRESAKGLEPDQRSWRAVRTLQAYAHGEIDGETLRKARDAATAAASSYDDVHNIYTVYAVAFAAVAAVAAVDTAAVAVAAESAAYNATRCGITWQWLLDTAVRHLEEKNV